EAEDDIALVFADDPDAQEDEEQHQHDCDYSSDDRAGHVAETLYLPARVAAMDENRQMRRLVVVVLLLAPAAFAASAAAGAWPQFGFDSARSNTPSAATGLTASNVARLVRQQVKLDGIADSNAVYLRGVTVGGSSHH